MTCVLVGARFSSAFTCAELPRAGLLEAGEVRKLTMGKQKPNTAGRRTFLWDMTQKGGKKFKKVLALG